MSKQEPGPSLDQYVAFIRDAGPSDGPTEFSWGPGLTPPSRERALPSEGGMYRGTTPRRGRPTDRDTGLPATPAYACGRAAEGVDRPNPPCRHRQHGYGCAGVTFGGPEDSAGAGTAWPWAPFRAPAPAEPKFCAALPHDSGTKRRVHSPPFLNWSVTGPVDA